MRDDEDAVKYLRDILRNMVNNHRWGGKHSELDSVMRRMRRAPPGSRKLVEKFIERSGWFQSKPSTGEIHISLNPERVSDIAEFLQTDEERAVDILNRYV